VLDASKALEVANASGEAPKIRDAMAALDAALRGQALARADVAQAQVAPEVAGQAADGGEAAAAPADGSGDAPAPAPKPAAAPRPVVARRGDDRPGMKKDEPASARGGKFGDRKPGGPGRFGDRDAGRSRFGDRPEREERGPRLGDVAFRAQRDAIEHAQHTLRKLAAQAHGEALTHLLAAWEQRDAEQVPSVGELGKSVAPAVRSAWVQALKTAPAGDASEALLRLEMAAEVPTPAEHLDARRAMQLQLLTRRNDPSPAQTWGHDAARVLASAHQPQAARRLQNVLKTLLR
jgi:ATP-dependent RNA helicase SUPV3L1/SUV3